jgi:hypothetical protein
MARWKFQLCPNEKGRLGVGYRLDPIGQAFEKRVNDALRYPFRFHRVNKLVICLGPTDARETDYIELLGVGQKQYPEFSYDHYIAASPQEREQMLTAITKDVFGWLLMQFEDSQFVEKAARNLDWLDLPSPRPAKKRPPKRPALRGRNKIAEVGRRCCAPPGLFPFLA